MLTMFALPLVGCAGPLYRPYDGKIGFSEAEVSPNTFTVFYDGTSKMSFGTATSFARARAAEIALDRGFGYFRVISAGNSTRTQVERYLADRPAGVGHRDELGDPYPISDFYEVPVAQMTIELLRDPAEDAFRAQQVYDEAVAMGIIPMKK